MKTIQRTLFGLAASLCLVVAANASTLYTAGASGEMASPASLPISFLAGAGAGSVSFQIQGYGSLDGDNSYIDIFHLTVNGSNVFSGTWDMGGGGANRVLASTSGYTLTETAKTVSLSVPVTFVAGSNSVVFSYESPKSFEGSTRVGPQGTGDEGWGINTIAVTGNTAVAAVPEPETYALMLAGLGALAFLGRRRSTSAKG